MSQRSAESRMCRKASTVWSCIAYIEALEVLQSWFNHTAACEECHESWLPFTLGITLLHASAMGVQG